LVSKAFTADERGLTRKKPKITTDQTIKIIGDSCRALNQQHD